MTLIHLKQWLQLVLNCGGIAFVTLSVQAGFLVLSCLAFWTVSQPGHLVPVLDTDVLQSMGCSIPAEGFKFEIYVGAVLT